MTFHPSDAAWPVWSASPSLLEPGAGAQALAPALAWVEAQSQAQGLPAKAQFAITLCADEALANITQYAQTHDKQAAKIWLACGPTATGFALEITDNGTAFDPTQAEPRALASTLEETPIGGHGLRLMRRYLHSMRYRREEDRNILMLEVACD